MSLIEEVGAGLDGLPRLRAFPVMRRIAILSLLFVSCSTSHLATRIERVVDEAVAAPIAEQRFAGVVVVARGGRPLFRKAYGMADREQGIAHTPDTPFMVMSVSKQFTAALIARLAVAGKLRLDASTPHSMTTGSCRRRSARRC